MYKLIEEHYRQEYKSLVSFANWRLAVPSHPIAEECVQEAYTKIMSYVNNGGTIQGEVPPLLFRILFNCIYDANNVEKLRGLTGNRRTTQIDYDKVNIEYMETDANSLNRLLLNLELGKFNYLKHPAKDVLTMFYVDGYSHKEIGKSLNISERSSRNIVSLHTREIEGGDQ